MYLDCDTTPARRSRYCSAKRIEKAVEAAASIIDNVTEGQIGIYDGYLGEFRGYVIKHAGSAPYFEPSIPEVGEDHARDVRSPADRLSSLRLIGPEREMVAALLGFVACGLACGSTLDQMQAIAFAELERARKLAAKNQRRTFRIEGSRIVSSLAASTPG
jgi:hypothetical protein